MPSTEIQVILVAVALLAGVGITAIGPGGILLTIALYALLPIPPPVVAGTASATFVAAGVVGSISYLRSGELADRSNRRLALWLSGASVLGAIGGTLVNPWFSEATYGTLLGLATVAAGGAVLWQQRGRGRQRAVVRAQRPRGRAGVVWLGLGLGFACALLGVGGPVFAVPALVLLGVPMIAAVAVAQVQSIVIAAFATAGYLVQGAVSWRLGLLVGIPQLLGVLGGWWFARRADPERLKTVLGAILISIGGYLLLR